MIAERKPTFNIVRGERTFTARNAVAVEADLDNIQKTSGDPDSGAVTVGDLITAGVLKRSKGKLVAKTVPVSGAQALQTFLKGRQ